jgi:transposase
MAGETLNETFGMASSTRTAERVCVYFAKRLEDGIFRWPRIEDGVMRLSAAQLSAPLEGLDWRLVHEARETPAPTQAG